MSLMVIPNARAKQLDAPDVMPRASSAKTPGPGVMEKTNKAMKKVMPDSNVIGVALMSRN